MTNPYAPGWRPEHRSDASLPHDVGSGTGFGTDLHQLYKAGRALLPDVAATYAALTQQVHDTEPAMRQAFDIDGDIVPANQLILDLRAELQQILRRSSYHIEEIGRALVDIADRYAATDEAAAQQMARLIDYHHDDLYQDPPPAMPPRPEPGDPPRRRAENTGAGRDHWV